MSRGVARETWTIPTLPPGDWTRQAACRDADTDLFFTDADTAKALTFCRGCPVQAQCEAYALDHGQVWGVWGGTTPQQRKGRYRHRQARCGTRAGYKAHRRKGEEPCEPCNTAHLAYQRKWYSQQHRAGVA